MVGALLGVVASALVYAGTAGGAAPSASPVPATTWVPNGTVRAIVRVGDAIYLGGDFTRISPRTGSGVVVAPTGSVVRTAEIAGGEVRAVVSDGAGGWYVGGGFDYVGGQTHHSLAHIRADGTPDAGWNPAPGGDVQALATDASTVYVTTVSYEFVFAEASVIAYDRTSGAERWSVDASRDNPDNEDPSLDAVAVARGTVYVGGNFTSIGGVDLGALAALDARTGRVKRTLAGVSIDPCVYGGSHCWGLPSVEALAVGGDTLYVAGLFDHAGKRFRNTLAAFALPSGLPRAFDAHLKLDDDVFALAPSGRDLYVGGRFARIGGARRSALAALDTRSGRARRWAPRAAPETNELALAGRYVYALSSPSMLQRFDRRTGSRRVVRLAANGPVHAVVPGAAGLFAGGDFSGFGGVARPGLAALDATTGEPISWSPQLTGKSGLRPTVAALAANARTLFVSGAFTRAGGSARTGMAAFDLASGGVTGWDPAPDGDVRVLVPAGGVVFAGGDYHRIGGAARTSLAALDATTGLATAWDAKLGSFSLVESLALSGSTLYVGGGFQSVGGEPRMNVAAVDAGSGAPLALRADADNGVEALLPVGGTLYVGGSFAKIGGVARPSLAAIDPVTGAVLPWSPATDGRVHALARRGGRIVVGGDFGKLGGVARENVGAVDAATASVDAWNPGAGRFGVEALAAAGSAVYLGGSFAGVAGVPAWYFAAVPAP